MSPYNTFEIRQIWAHPTSKTTSSHTPHCTPFTIPSNGILTINDDTTITLTQDAVFAPECTSDASSYTTVDGVPSTNIHLRDPFYSSTAPQMYAIAAATVISYLLVIMLFITPRTYFVGGPGGGAGFLGRRGVLSSSYGNPSIVGVGGRPWLQKVAASTVAISLTIASADTYKVARRQYEMGFSDSSLLTDEVVAGLEIRIVRLISTTFLWLAQVQTLIRLFPRHKEKIVIKWTGFALIVLDTIFAILNSFVEPGQKTKPRSFEDAVPALSYLFELGIGIIYAACVIYYSLSKMRFAFFHPRMSNICLVALLSITAVMVPIVFFVLDVSKPDVSGWGDYIRWVGAAAASVVVWEWVERIEALERDERKDGILGREIFDGDEMLEVTPSDEIDWPGRRQNGQNGPAGGSGAATGRGQPLHYGARARMGYHYRPAPITQPSQVAVASGALPRPPERTQPTPPAATVSPVSRTDTNSAASTVYAVHHHTLGSPSPQIPVVPQQPVLELAKEISEPSTADISLSAENHQAKPKSALRQPWQAVANPFKRRRASPPAEVAAAQASDAAARQTTQQSSAPASSTPWHLRTRLGALGAKKEGVSERANRSGPGAAQPLVIPAPARDQVSQPWSPGNVAEDKAKGHTSRGIWPDRNKVRPASLPIKVIPAPVRGQRTWSPDDADMSRDGPVQTALGEDTTLMEEHGPSNEVGDLPIDALGDGPSSDTFTSARAMTLVEPDPTMPISTDISEHIGQPAVASEDQPHEETNTSTIPPTSTSAGESQHELGPPRNVEGDVSNGHRSTTKSPR